MTQKIKITISDLNKAQECVTWLRKNVGPVLPGNSGTLVRGEGWQYWVGGKLPELWSVTIELNEHVDDDTQLLFALKWS
jgi:hypothetical protein